MDNLKKYRELLEKYWTRYSIAHQHVSEHASLPKKELSDHKHEQKKVFADGCGFYKLFWVFLLGSFYGDIVETLFVRVTAGEWMSRSSLVFGQFSLVWGIGCFLLTLFLHRMIGWEDRYILIAGTVLGGAFEYFCSVFTEKAFGVVFWDYSHMRFNLNGRINLLYCFFWGIMAVVWLKMIYPWMSKCIERIPVLWGKVLTWVLLVFMVVNIFISAAALYRMNMRDADPQPRNWAERYVDTHFTDEWIKN
ncbi:MAG: putative ABC transporter permease, partial [Eubacteriales bacterium]|nr:putative ABC transporter permease [Eubacteriales bacterium]